MKKKILVLGGSYFVGRVFMILASRSGEYDLHVLNRGTYNLSTDHTTEYVCDRHDSARAASILPSWDWDAVVDFCADEPGDIAGILDVIKGGVGQYLFISTSSVYFRGGPSPKDENSSLLAEAGGCCLVDGDRGCDYAHKKLHLEREAAGCCAKRNIPLTIIRPSLIYGPFNYTPRESFYFNCIIAERPIIVPTDATGRFNFVNVRDVARILLGCIGNEKTYGGIYNAAAPEAVTYETFFEALEAAHGSELLKEFHTVEQIYAQNIPMPFPMDCDELYSGEKIAKLLGHTYMPFGEGLADAYQIYMRAVTK